jgi:hypothetical protein
MTEPTEVKRDVKLAGGACQTFDHFTGRWSVVLAPFHEYTDCANPAFWSIVAPRIGRDDIIEVRTEDQRFFAELYVIDSNQQGLSVVEMRYKDLQGKIPELAADTGYIAKWKGPQLKWCVIRDSDDVVMQKQLVSKAAAHTWIQLQLAA